MFKGKELGQAIAQAIKLKKASGAISREVEIACHFGVKQPSLADWKKRGTISKEKLPELWRYFSDVVGPEHWGLKEFPTDSNRTPASELTTEEQIQDSIRLRELFAKRAGMSQLEFGRTYGIGNQGMVWQYLNADKPKGSVLNIFAAIKFAEGLRCPVSDFSPSIQEEIDSIAGFATEARKGAALKKDKHPLAPPQKAIVKTADIKLTGLSAIHPKAPAPREMVVSGLYVQAQEETQAAIDALLLSPEDRGALAEASKEGENACAGIRLLEREASKALSALHDKKKAQNRAKSD